MDREGAQSAAGRADAARAVQAGGVYFAILFALGFCLGAARTFLVTAAPVSRLDAVLIEAPLMTLAAWLICARIVARMRVAPTLGVRLIMGGVALGLLLLGEVCVGLFLLGQSVGAQIRALADPSYGLGLIAQIVCAWFPLAQARPR